MSDVRPFTLKELEAAGTVVQRIDGMWVTVGPPPPETLTWTPEQRFKFANMKLHD